jgi:hypothetical protein
MHVKWFISFEQSCAETVAHSALHTAISSCSLTELIQIGCSDELALGKIKFKAICGPLTVGVK